MKQGHKSKRLRNEHSYLDFSRRNLMRGAAGMVAGLALFPKAWPIGQNEVEEGARVVNPPTSAVMLKLSTYMSEAGGRALPGEVVEKAKQHILDTFAAMVSGSRLPAGLAAIKFIRAYGGKEVSTVIASDIRCGPIEAALVNAEMAHADETDDSHAPSESHPGCSIVPGALAMGEQFHSSGIRYLRAVVLGYDVGTRFSMAFPRAAFHRIKRDTHAFVGDFGTAAATASLAGLTPQQMRWVLDYAGQQSSGYQWLYRDTQHIEKAFVFAGMPSRDGITAAQLVHSGWTGVNDILSGENNLIMAFPPGANPAGFIDKLGERYEITRTNIKKWPVGSPVQAPLDALEDLRKQHPFDAQQVKKVIVKLRNGKGGIVDNAAMPNICLQYLVAVMLIDKTVTFQAANDKARMTAPAIMRQRAKVDLESDDKLGLQGRRDAIVQITLTDGTQLRKYVDHVRGTYKNPMTRAEVVAKARDLMTPVLGATRCSTLIQKVLEIEKVKDIQEFRPLLQVKS